MKSILLVSSLIVWNALSAQKLYTTDYQFNDSIQLSSIDPEYVEEEEVLLLDKTIHEFVLSENSLDEYVLKHIAVYVNSEKAIEENNKVYLPLSDNYKMVEEGCRVIRKSGVQELNKSNIQQTSGDDESEQYRYYAVDGLEQGSIVEYYYVYQRPAKYTGTYLTIQSSIPKQRVAFEIISPDHLIFKAKSMNGFPEGVADTLGDGRNVLRFRANKVPAMEEEPWSNLAANGMRVVYKLAENTYTGNSSMHNYAPISQNVWNNTHTDDKGERKLIQKELKKLKLSDNMELADRIRAIENHLKFDYGVIDASDDRLSDIPFMIENKVYNEYGAVRYLASMFKEAGIEHEIVLTNERNESFVDPEFECYCHLQEYLFYFPELDQYLDPSANLYRLPLIDSDFRDNYGLFISSLTIGDVESASGSLKKIPLSHYKDNMQLMDIEVKLNEDQDVALVKSKLTWTGMDAASNMQGMFSYVDEDRKKELDETLQNMQLDGADVTRFEKVNAGVEYVGKEPFILEVDYQSPDLVEYAGDAVILKIGLVIGPQAELYQEKERTLPVEQGRNRGYDREIRLQIPDGMSCGNLDDLRFNVIAGEGKVPKAAFVSNYKVEGNWVIVTIEEIYSDPYFTVEEYDEFAKVINAAADFNKVKLVFKPS